MTSAHMMSSAWETEEKLNHSAEGKENYLCVCVLSQQERDAGSSVRLQVVLPTPLRKALLCLLGRLLLPHWIL